MRARTIALAVPCFNEAPRLPGLIAAIAALDPPPGLLLAVDDGSSDDSAQILEQASFEVIVQPRNLGLGAGRNALWRRAERRGMQAIAYLDADVLPPADYLGGICAVLATDRVAGVGGRNLDPLDGPWVDRWRGRYFAQSLGERAMLDAPMLVGALSTYRIAALRDVGGFDSRFRTHGEDVDIGRRLRLAGHRLRYEPSITVQHRRHDDPRSLVRACFLHCREGMRATLATPGEDPEPAQLVLGMARKVLRAPAGALIKRKDPREALLGAAACGAGLLGYLVGLTRP